MTHYEPPAEKSGLGPKPSTSPSSSTNKGAGGGIGSSSGGGRHGRGGGGVEGYMVGDEEELHSDVEIDGEDLGLDHGVDEHKETGLAAEGSGLAAGIEAGSGLGYTILLESKTSSVDHAAALLVHAEVIRTSLKDSFIPPVL